MIATIATSTTIAPGEQAEHPRNLLRVVLAVPVEHHDPLASARGKSGGEGRRLAPAMIQADAMDPYFGIGVGFGRRQPGDFRP